MDWRLEHLHTPQEGAPLNYRCVIHGKSQISFPISWEDKTSSREMSFWVFSVHQLLSNGPSCKEKNVLWSFLFPSLITTGFLQDQPSNRTETRDPGFPEASHQGQKGDKMGKGTSLVVQRLRIHRPMQGTQVRSLIWEDPKCQGAKPLHTVIEPVLQSQRAETTEACMP